MKELKMNIWRFIVVLLSGLLLLLSGAVLNVKANEDILEEDYDFNGAYDVRAYVGMNLNNTFIKASTNEDAMLQFEGFSLSFNEQGNSDVCDAEGNIYEYNVTPIKATDEGYIWIHINDLQLKAYNGGKDLILIDYGGFGWVKTYEQPEEDNFNEFKGFKTAIIEEGVDLDNTWVKISYDTNDYGGYIKEFSLDLYFGDIDMTFETIDNYIYINKEQCYLTPEILECKDGSGRWVHILKKDVEHIVAENELTLDAGWSLTVTAVEGEVEYKYYEGKDYTGSGGSTVQTGPSKKEDDLSTFEKVSLIISIMCELVILGAIVAKVPNGKGKWIAFIVLLISFMVLDACMYLHLINLL